MSVMYRSGYWVRRDKAQKLSNLLFRFLGGYAKCAHLCLNQHKRRYSMVPKLHMIAHSAYDLYDQSVRAEWAQNPIATTNQIQEDYIGRPSRLSRRVNLRSLHKSMMMRCLIVYHESLLQAAEDLRGMDGYPDV